jgi:uncharacterized membrane protein
MSLAGWLHTVLAIVALITGAMNLARAKGTASHRWIGRVFALAMLGLNVSALTIYRLTGHFEVFHAFALSSLAMLAVAIVPIVTRRPRRGWLELHYFGVGVAYAGLLAAFGNELLTRVPALHAAIVGTGPLTPALLGRIFQIGGFLGPFATELALALLIWRHDAVMDALGRRPASRAPEGWTTLSEVLFLLGAVTVLRLGVVQFWPQAGAAAARVFGPVVALSILLLAYRPPRERQDLRWLAAYFLLAAFGDLFAILGHFEPRALMAVRPSIPLFGLVALGLYLDDMLVVLGLAAIGLVFIAYHFAGGSLALATGIIVGGAEIATGWRMRSHSTAPLVTAAESVPR